MVGEGIGGGVGEDASVKNLASENRESQKRIFHMINSFINKIKKRCAPERFHVLLKYL